MLGSALDVPPYRIMQTPGFRFSCLMRVSGDRRLGKGLDLQKYLPESWPATAVKLISNFHTVVYIRRLIRNNS